MCRPRLQVREDGSARPPFPSTCVRGSARPPGRGVSSHAIRRCDGRAGGASALAALRHYASPGGAHEFMSFSLPFPGGDGRLDRGHYRGPRRVPAQGSAAGSFSRDNGGARGLELCGPFVSRAAALISGFGGYCQLVQLLGCGVPVFRTLADRIARFACLIPGITDLAL